MKILYISNEYPPDTGFGGIGTYTKYAAEGMAGLGHNVHVICRSESGEAHTQKDGAVVVHRVGAGTYPLPAGRAWYPLRKACRALVPHLLIRLAWARQVSAALASLHKSGERFDIIEFPECGAEGLCLAKRQGAKTVVRLHTPWSMVAKLDSVRETGADRLLIAHVERTAARAADAPTSPTRALASLLQKRWRINTATVFPNPIPASRYEATLGNDWIYVGRVERRKGVHVLLAAYSNLCKSVDPPVLRIVGRPYGPWERGIEYGNYIEKLIHKLNASQKIEWIRGTSHDTVRTLLSRSAVAVFPSLWENLSYSCLEAMASGCAVVASACGGFQEIIAHGDNGMLFPAGDSEELTRTLYRLLMHDAARRQLGTAGRAWVSSHCDTSVVAPQIESLYKSLL